MNNQTSLLNQIISQIELSTQETSKSMGYRTANRNQRAKQLARIQETKDTRWHLIR